MLPPLQAPFDEAVGLFPRVPLKKFGTDRPLTCRIEGAAKEIGRSLVQKNNPLPVVGDENRVRETSHPGEEPSEVEA